MTEIPTGNPREYCVFGYGSLIWKPPPYYAERVPGFLKGYVRRFAQSSSDHRGTPEHPGRVVTLIAAVEWSSFSSTDEFPHEDVVWGVCYTISPGHAAEMKEYLDHREKDGYTVHHLDVWGVVDGVEKIIVPNEPSNVKANLELKADVCTLVMQATCYVGRSDNPSFVGSEPIPALARKIWESSGPSGPNKEYLYQLARAVRELAPESHDSHLSALETHVRQLDKQSEE
ncbi:hypothetical protein OPQ81_009304 [Rhizoctonia solani]|nr:hypothetical protein OPQ81_009304 [Rhizoctonia solani]